MTDPNKLKAQADFLFANAMGQARKSGLLPAGQDQGRVLRKAPAGASVAILGAEAVAGGFLPPGEPHISTQRAARAHAKANAPKDDRDIERIIEANRRRREKARRQASGIKA